MEQIESTKRKNPKQSISMIIEGASITKIIEADNAAEYGEVINTVSSVIFCRSSPKEKGNIVNFVK